MKSFTLEHLNYIYSN